MKHLLLFLLLILTSCSYHEDKGGAPTGLSSSQLGYAQVQSSVFGPRCARCHAGDVVASYESVVAHLPEITRRMQLPAGAPGAMPPGGPVSPQELQAVLAWSRAGAPREAGVGGTPGQPSVPPPPTTPPVTPPPTPALPFSFAEVNAKVFAPKCARCHRGMMASYESVTANLSEIDSMISSGQMPPARASQLSAEERDLVLRWIALGGPKDGVRDPGPAPAPEPEPAPAPTPTPRPAPTLAFFAEVQEKVLTPKCARCHSGLVSSYEKVQAKLGAIDSVVRGGQMPPARAPQLTSDERELLLGWIARGAPKEAAGTPAPAPRPCSRHDDDDDDHRDDDDHEHC